MVIEFKITENIDDLGKKANEAIQQIKNIGYDLELRDEGYKKIVRYGIALTMSVREQRRYIVIINIIQYLAMYTTK